MSPTTHVQVDKSAMAADVKALLIFGGGGALLGGLLFGAKGAVILGVGAPIAFVALIASALKGMQ